jgi:hypothetical protein
MTICLEEILHLLCHAELVSASKKFLPQIPKQVRNDKSFVMLNGVKHLLYRPCSTRLDSSLALRMTAASALI